MVDGPFLVTKRIEFCEAEGSIMWVVIVDLDLTSTPTPISSVVSLLLELFTLSSDSLSVTFRIVLHFLFQRIQFHINFYYHTMNLTSSMCSFWLSVISAYHAKYITLCYISKQNLLNGLRYCHSEKLYLYIKSMYCIYQTKAK